MKKILIIIMLIVSLTSCSNTDDPFSVNSDTNTSIATESDSKTEELMVIEGIAMHCENGSFLIFSDCNGGYPELTPISLSANNKSINFDVISNGDKIKISTYLINETYPCQATAYGIKKISDGSLEDIPSEILVHLEEMGWSAV